MQSFNCRQPSGIIALMPGWATATFCPARLLPGWSMHLNRGQQQDNLVCKDWNEKMPCVLSEQFSKTHCQLNEPVRRGKRLPCVEIFGSN